MVDFLTGLQYFTKFDKGGSFRSQVKAIFPFYCLFMSCFIRVSFLNPIENSCPHNMTGTHASALTAFVIVHVCTWDNSTFLLVTVVVACIAPLWLPRPSPFPSHKAERKILVHYAGYTDSSSNGCKRYERKLCSDTCSCWCLVGSKWKRIWLS